MADAEAVLLRDDIGEMERQIQQAQHMELAFNLLQRVAVLEGDNAMLKNCAEQASKWAGHMRSATTKRKNDIVPELVEAVTKGASWSEAAKRLAEKQQ
jgi:hypothetical protein